MVFYSVLLVAASENFCLIATAIVQTLQRVDECFGVGVVSVAIDGAAPELNPGWVHRRINTFPEVRYAQVQNFPENKTYRHAVPIRTLHPVGKLRNTHIYCLAYSA